MGKVANKIREDFTVLDSQREAIEIPEWDLSIFVGPWTWGQMLKVQDSAEAGSIDMLRIVIEVKAKNESGQPAFDADDISEMKSRGDPALIRRIGNAILEKFPLTFDDEKK